MSTPQVLMALQQTGLASAIRGDVDGADWLFPIIETLHVFSLAIVFGTVAMVDLRLVGVSALKTPVSKVTGEALTWTWAAFACAAVTGTLLFISKADIYWNNFQFRGKFLCMALAGLNMLVFHLGAFRDVARWDLSLPPPATARLAGALSLACWCGVVIFARWTGFTT